MKQTTMTCGPANAPHQAPVQPRRVGDDVLVAVLPHDDADGNPCGNAWRTW